MTESKRDNVMFLIYSLQWLFFTGLAFLFKNPWFFYMTIPIGILFIYLLFSRHFIGKSWGFIGETLTELRYEKIEKEIEFLRAQSRRQNQNNIDVFLCLKDIVVELHKKDQEKEGVKEEEKND